jgi:hypothetical protein
MVSSKKDLIPILVIEEVRYEIASLEALEDLLWTLSTHVLALDLPINIKKRMA